MKSLLTIALAILGASTALAASPDWSRTLQWPFTGREFSTVPPQGGCVPSHGCFRVENWTDSWVSPGLEGVAGASPGSALVVDASGIVHGVYVGEYGLVGGYNDPQFGRIDAINGDFRPAIAPKEGGVSPRVYVTVDPGVTMVLADRIQFRADAKPRIAYDVGLGRVVEYTPGKGRVVQRCTTYNNVNDRANSPELAAITCR